MATPLAAAHLDDAAYESWIQQDSGRTVRIVRALTVWFWDHVYRLRSSGVEHVPVDGAFLLVPNHSSWADPFVQVRPITRLVRFMGKSSLFEVPVLRWILRSGGAFPVRRGESDAFAIELAGRLLDAGQPVVIYPEGTRYRDSLELGPPKRGAARLALQHSVPIVPCATWGVKRRELYGRPRWRRPQAVTVYGEPLVFDLDATLANVNHVRDVVWEHVEALYDVARTIAQQR